MLLSAVSVLAVGQSSSEIPEGLMNNPVFQKDHGLENFARNIWGSEVVKHTIYVH